MIANLLKLFSLNRLIIMLVVLLATTTIASGYALKKSYEKTGELKNDIKEFNTANKALARAYTELDIKVQKRDIFRKNLIRENRRLKGEINEISDTNNCLDVPSPDAISLFINKS